MAHEPGGEGGVGGIGLDRESDFHWRSATRDASESSGGSEHSNDHLALVYEDADEQLSAAIPFVREGLEEGERCLYVADDNSPEAVREAMREYGIDVDAAVESGALSIHTKSDTYLRTGEFDRDAMLTFWEECLAEAKEADYEGIRAAAEMTWALEEDASLDLLAEYEAMLNSIYRGEDYAVLCQYDRERFPAEVLREVIRTHPHIVQGGGISRNAFYAPPEEYLEADRDEQEIDRMMATIRENATARRDVLRVFESDHDAVFLLDPEADEIVDANPAACELLGYAREELLDLDPSALHPHDSTVFRGFVNEVRENGAVRASNLSCRTSDGRPVSSEFSGALIESADRPLVLLAVRDHVERQRRERLQRQLYELVADADRTFEEKLRAVFDLGTEELGMDLGGVARIDPTSDRFEVEFVSDDHEYLQPGAEVDLSETYCRVHDVAGETVGVRDAEAAGFEGATAYEEFGVNSYIGTRIALDDGLDRTLFFVSSDPRDAAFSAFERTFLDLAGQWVSYELDRQRSLEQLRALDDLNGVVRDVNRALVRQSSREDIERIVCDRLVESDSYGFARIEPADEAGSVDPPEASAGTPPADLDPSARSVEEALRTGDLQVDKYPERASEGTEVVRVRSVVVPITHEERSYGALWLSTERENAFDDTEREVVGYLGEIVGMAIALVEHERQLAHERERLELVNRLLRHNLLNDLNVVQARSGLIEGRIDPEASGHLDIVQDRTEDMIDLVQALRTLMRATLGENGHELERVDLGSVLADEIEDARRAFEDAEFRARNLDDAGVVMADDLLGEVFENLLGNAVQHNDSSTPLVTVDVEPGEESVTVRVSDNGPGIPGDLTGRLFEKGAKGFESPGTGFGLHLVREIVDAYDGSITAENNERSGATFSVTLPRARSD